MDAQSNTLTNKYVFTAELTQAVLRQKRDRHLCAWYAIDAYNKQCGGRGYMLRRSAAKLLRETLGWHRNTINQVLESGDGDFWNIATSRRSGKPTLRVVSLRRLLQHFGLSSTNNLELRPIEELRSNYGKLRIAWYYLAEYKPIDPKEQGKVLRPTSRARQTEKYGRTVQTIHRWENKARGEKLDKALRAQVKSNYTILSTHSTMDAAVAEHYDLAGCPSDVVTINRFGYTSEQGVPGYNSYKFDDNKPRPTGPCMPRYFNEIGACIVRQGPNSYARTVAPVSEATSQYLRNLRMRHKTRTSNKTCVGWNGQLASAYAVTAKDRKDRRRIYEPLPTHSKGNDTLYRGRTVSVWAARTGCDNQAWGVSVCA